MGGAIENEIYPLLDCPVYKDLGDTGDSLFLGVLETEEITQGFLKSLKLIWDCIRKAIEKREATWKSKVRLWDKPVLILHFSVSFLFLFYLSIFNGYGSSIGQYKPRNKWLNGLL